MRSHPRTQKALVLALAVCLALAVTYVLPGGLAAAQEAARAAGGATPAGGPSEEPAGPAEPLYATRLYLDGERIILPVPAVISGGHTLAPVRAVFERFGASVLWDGDKRVTISLPGAAAGSGASGDGVSGGAPAAPGRTIDLWLGSTLASVDGRHVTLEVAPVMWRSRVLVPLRFVAENLGLTLAWDNDRRAVILTKSPAGPAKPIEDINLAFAGDVLLGSWIADRITAYGVDYPWTKITPVLSAADITMVNLESSVSTRGTPYPKTWTFRAAPASLDGLKDAGVDIVSVANNHVLDYGKDAFADTLANLDQRGIKRVGAGANKEEAWRPVIIEARGYKVGYLAATYFYPEEWVATADGPGICSARDIEALADAVAKLRPEVDILVVSVHWGIEYDRNPDAFQHRCGHALVDAGADLVIGHHPHIPQGMEVYKGRLIAWSLGNFVFTPRSGPGTETGVLVVTIDKQGLAAARFVPAIINDARPIPCGGEAGEALLAKMNEWSREWGTTFDPAGYILLP